MKKERFSSNQILLQQHLSFERSNKGKFDSYFDAGLKFFSDLGYNDLTPHFIFCQRYFRYPEMKEMLKKKKKMLKKMKKYGIPSLVLTALEMYRRCLITKEKQKQAYKGKLKNDNDWGFYEGSINDDLESFFNNLQNFNDLKEEEVISFFLPKLTQDELKLVEKQDKTHLNTYSNQINGRNPDVDEEEMKKSDSKDKYLLAECHRWTIHLTIESTSDK